MKITVINGTEKHGITYRLKEIFLSEFKDNADITEYYLPKDCPEFCNGCTNCILKGENTCKDNEKVQKISRSLRDADLIVMTTPAYVFHATGAMKVLLDHLAYQWMPHRPAPEMFKKRAVILTQCLGAGARSAARDIQHSLAWWGISDIKTCSVSLMQDIYWDKLTDKKRSQLTKKVSHLSKVCSNIDYSRPPHTSLAVKFKFCFCRLMHKSLHKTHPESHDTNYWYHLGWLDHTRPWK